MEKKCLSCLTIKPLSNFGKSKGIKKYYYRSYCKECAIKKLKQWRNNNLDKIQEIRKKEYQKNSQIYKKRAKQQYKKNPKENRNRFLQRKYNITIDEYNKLLKEQKNVCAICSKKLGTDSRKKCLSVDHCHKNGKIRGLLCENCNSGLGLFKENIIILNNAVNYLRDSNS